MRRYGARRLLLGLAALVGSTGFATCGGEAPEEERSQPESAAEATIEEEQEDMDRDTNR